MADTSFANMVATYAANKPIPNIRFLGNTNFANLIGHLVQTLDCEGDTPADYINCFYAAKEAGNVPAFQEFQDAASAFADKLGGCMTALRDIHDTVTLLTPKVKQVQDQIIAADPFAATHLGKTDYKCDYEKMPWDDMLLVGSYGAVMAVVSNILDNDQIDPPTHLLIGNLLRKLPFGGTDEATYHDISLPDEVSASLCKKLQTALPELLAEDICRALITVTSKEHFLRMIDLIKERALEQSDEANTCLLFLKAIRVFRPMLRALVQSYEDLSEDTQVKINENIKLIEEYLFFCAYYLAYARLVVFKDILLLQNKMINPDNWEEYEQKGGTDQALCHHVTLFYKSGIPGKGINMSEVLDKMVAVQERMKKDTTNIAMRLKMITNSALSSAISSVLSNYLTTTIEKADGEAVEVGTDKILSIKADGYVAKDMTIEDALYDFLINNVNQCGLVKTIYTRLGVKFTQQLVGSSEITENDTKILQAEVISELVAEFLVKNFIQKTV